MCTFSKSQRNSDAWIMRKRTLIVLGLRIIVNIHKCQESAKKVSRKSLLLFSRRTHKQKMKWEKTRHYYNNAGCLTHRVPSHPNPTAEPGSTDPSSRCPLVSPAWRLVKIKTHTTKKKGFLPLNPETVKSVPCVLKWVDRVDGECYGPCTGSWNLHICSARHALLLFQTERM